jgi:Fe-S cluster assembly ATPase SufC
MGQAASDSDYLTFQRSVNANVKGGAKMRHEILLRKLFRLSPSIADAFDPFIVAESGVSGRIANLGDSIHQLIDQLNKKRASMIGENLYKATNKTAHAFVRIRKAA